MHMCQVTGSEEDGGGKATKNYSRNMRLEELDEIET